MKGLPLKSNEVEKELIINSTPNKVEIALIEDGRLVELHHQKSNDNFSVGDIFLGKIKKLMPGLNAAFVDIGHKKDAFLHYTDLGPKLRSLVKYSNGVVNGSITTHRLDNFKIEPEIVKSGKVDQVLSKKFQLLVQILKEPISTKGPRLTCEITLPGRFLVLTPFSDVVAISKKIANPEERKRLQTLVESIRPVGFGIIVRTAAEGKKVADLHDEVSRMMSKWEDIFKQLQKGKAPLKLLSELDKTSSILRDLLTDSFNKVVTNDRQLFQNIKSYLESISPDMVKIASLYKGGKPIFEDKGITRQIKASFGKTATMSSGAYLVIESTEAMHVIDVNSGHKMPNDNQGDAILKVNLESAKEIARQLRLRDIGGLIVIDFIDMRNREHKKILHNQMREFMKHDRAQHTVLPLSKFGLIQITRQRVRPAVKIDTAEVCPTCEGSGKINASVLIIDEIERDINFILQSRPNAKITIKVHPFVDAFLKKGWPSKRMRWYRQFYKWFKIIADGGFHINEYKFFDGNNDEIRLN